MSLLQGVLRAEHGSAAGELSVYYVALDLRQVYRGMMIAIGSEDWTAYQNLSAKELAEVLREMARGIDLNRYQKSTRGPKKPVARKEYKNGGHVSTHKQLLQTKT